MGAVSSHSYHCLVVGELLVAVGGRASSPLWARDLDARDLNLSSRYASKHKKAASLPKTGGL